MNTPTMAMQACIENSNSTLFLVDAYGVLYTGSGPVPGAAEFMRYLQSRGHVYVLTNNSYLYPHYIVEKLAHESDIHLETSQIISSGHGLAFDATISSLIQSKTVFYMGSDYGIDYLKDAKPKAITNTLNDAELIVMGAYRHAEHQAYHEALKTLLSEKPDVDLVCCNPDRVVSGGDGKLYTVVGHYAAELQAFMTKPILWFGKPHHNFSNLVKSRLSHLEHDISQALFFDDNMHNVIQLSKDLNCQGVWVADTGIHVNQQDQAKALLGGSNIVSIKHFNKDAVLKSY